MGYPKSDPEQKILAICGGTTRAVIELIRVTALNRQITVSRLVGDILEEWSISQSVMESGSGSSVGEYQSYRRQQTPKRKRAARVVKSGPLGLEKREEELLKRVVEKTEEKA